MYIWAFDPGHSTGVALVRDDEGYPPIVMGLWTLNTGDQRPDNLVAHWKLVTGMRELVVPWSTELRAIVYESWRLRPGLGKQMTGSEFVPVQVIGQIKLLAYQGGLWDKLVKQEPYSQSGTLFDATLKRYGKALQIKTPHEKSALNHCLYYLKRQAAKVAQ